MPVEAWIAVVQDIDGHEETEVVTITVSPEGRPVIEVTDGVRITCVEPAAGVGEAEAAA